MKPRSSHQKKPWNQLSSNQMLKGEIKKIKKIKKNKAKKITKTWHDIKIK
jgi:hypothetical protein